MAILRRPNTNYVPGANIAISKADNPGLDAVDVTIDVIGIPTTGAAVTDTHAWMPLTTVVAGVPELVWDGDNNLIPDLVPL